MAKLGTWVNWDGLTSNLWAEISLWLKPLGWTDVMVTVYPTSCTLTVNGRCPHGMPFEVEVAANMDLVVHQFQSLCEKSCQGHNPPIVSIQPENWYVEEKVNEIPSESISIRKELAEVIPGLLVIHGCPVRPVTKSCRGAGNAGNTPIWGTIVHLNDHHGWSRERIATWLESLDVDLSITAASKGD